MASIKHVEAILADEQRNSSAESKEPGANDSIVDLREQINQVPYIHGNTEEKKSVAKEDLDCNFEVVAEAHFSEEFIDQFSNNFGSFLHNLETIAL